MTRRNPQSLAEYEEAAASREAIVAFFVDGEPVPQPRPRVYRGRTVSNTPRVKSWKQQIQWEARKTGADKWSGCPVGVKLVFQLRRPPSTKRREPHVRPDLDNLTKAVMDALEGICFRNDGQVTMLITKKVYHERYGVAVTVMKRGERNE